MGFDRSAEARILPTNLLVYSLRGMPRAPKKGEMRSVRRSKQEIYRFDGQSVNYVDSSVSGNKIFPKASSHCSGAVTAYLHRPYLTPRFAGILNTRMRPFY